MLNLVLGWMYEMRKKGGGWGEEGEQRRRRGGVGLVVKVS